MQAGCNIIVGSISVTSGCTARCVCHCASVDGCPDKLRSSLCTGLAKDARRFQAVASLSLTEPGMTY